ncbi:hypothetical protein GCM10009630_36740 [Kribbella jejuensis]|uniref:Uncharacterized protein n=1 Tax=Kribbella jejuensis TaxID=236068 RepID=A0A542ET22_9ACTN|nr:DUF5946 family protein [Kribbella jejuensis]TQJ18374.1 hypothetical protein FB475_2509 [Kribbella jejuensis]
MNTPDDTRSSTICPGCRAELPVSDWPETPKYNASRECAEVAGELLGFEIEHAARLGYLHQLRIDAYGAQHVNPNAPRIGPVFALNGLYMFLERGSGNVDVRTAHGIMANSYDDWPRLVPPARAGELTAYDVLTAGGVDEVESTLLRWAAQVWESWPDAERETIRNLTVELVPERYFRRR